MVCLQVCLYIPLCKGIFFPYTFFYGLDRCAFVKTDSGKLADISVPSFLFPYFMHSLYGIRHILLPISGRWLMLEGKVITTLTVLCSYCAYICYDIVIETVPWVVHNTVCMTHI
jgi:hypothetical protein